MVDIHQIDETKRAVWPALFAGMRGLCPNCHEGKVFTSFLKVSHKCDTCGEELHHHRADDAPPYLTIFIVGHIVIPLMLLVEKVYTPAMWIHWMTWPLMGLFLALLMLPAIKGGFVNLQWALRMHGFDASGDEETAKLPAE
ncbi:MAG: DUF983 domain-containing protein [Alphaproteobacteria bacterium]